jgi:diacylglycerol kinase (ATP)
MRVLLIHNRKAGEGEYRSREIAGLIEQAGHTVRIVRRKDDDLERHIVQPFDLVAISGGDGSVTDVASRLFEHPVPFTILPLGTANNIAESLGISGEPASIIAGWKSGAIVPFDALVARHPGGEQVLFESAGLGLFTEAMCLAISHREKEQDFTTEDRFDRDFRLLRRMAKKLRAVPCSIEVDGKRSRKRVLLCEVMNTRQIGSHLVFAPDATTGDRTLDLVIVTEGRRRLLQRFLDRDPSDDHPPHLPILRGQRFRITSRSRRIHLDDTIANPSNGKSEWSLEIAVRPGALQVLVPTAARNVKEDAREKV